MTRFEKGQSFIELIIALGIGVAIMSIASGGLFLILRSGQLAQQNSMAASLTGSLIDNLIVISQANWHNIYDLNNGSSNHYYVSTSTGQLAIQSGDENLIVNGTVFTRYFYIEDISRDGSGNIESAYNSLNDDPSTQRITAVVSSQIGGSSLAVNSVIYITRSQNFVFNQTDWIGGSGQEGPITQINNKFASQQNIDFATTPGSIVPITVNLINVYVSDLDNDRVQKFDSSGTFILKWGSQGTGNGQFKKPYGIAIDVLNNVYVVDKDNNRVQKFDSNGNYLLQWGGDGDDPGEFGHPQGIAIDSTSNIYVVDLDRDRIQKFDSSGNFILEWGDNGSGNGEFKKPQDVATDSSNNVYVTDHDNNRVQKFDSNGNYILQWGTDGSGNGQFKKPLGIGIDTQNNVYVADRDNDRVQKFDSNGNYLLQWGGDGNGNGQFQKPEGVTTDQNNNIYVSDTDNHRVQKFDSNGNYLLRWGSNGNGDGQFNHPRGLEQIFASCSLGNCFLTSSIFDTGVSGGASLNTIMWQGNQPADTSVKFQIASSNNFNGPWNYSGSDGSSSTYYSPAGPNAQVKIRPAEHNNKRYFRYKVFFDISGGIVPRIDDIILSWSR